MMFKFVDWRALAALMVLFPALAMAQTAAGKRGTVEERLGRVERLLDTRSLVELLGRVEALQRELRDLRGEVELQTHTIRQLKSRQKDLYLDLDERLKRVAAGGATAPAAAPVAPAGAPVAGAAPATPAPPTATVATPSPGANAPAAPSAAPAPVQAPSIDPVAEQNAYQEAFNLLKEGRYDEAADAFQAFLAGFGGGKYAVNAQYWLGETYYVTRKFEPALAEFEKLLATYPNSRKIPAAMLKIGYIRDELEQTDAARQILNDLVNRFPSSPAARLARDRLQQLKSG